MGYVVTENTWLHILDDTIVVDRIITWKKDMLLKVNLKEMNESFFMSTAYVLQYILKQNEFTTMGVKG